MPITNNMRERFEFFDFTVGIDNNLKFEKMSNAKALTDVNGEDKDYGVKPVCHVCGKGLMNVVIYSYKEGNTMEYYALGVVCASNIECIKEIDGMVNIDKMNYDRQVKLKKKTMIKRMLEFEAERGRIILESQYHDEMIYLHDLVGAYTEMLHNRYLPSWDHDFTLREILGTIGQTRAIYHVIEDETNFFHSLYNAVNRKGKLSEKQMTALQKAMWTSVEDRIGRLEQKLDYEDEKEWKSEVQRGHFSLVINLLSPYKYRLSQKDRKFLESVKEWKDSGKYYSDKQMSVIRGMWKRYSDIPLEQVSRVFEEGGSE